MDIASGYRTYEKMYNTSVVPVFSYGAGIWGFKKDGPAEKIITRNYDISKV